MGRVALPLSCRPQTIDAMSTMAHQLTHIHASTSHRLAACVMLSRRWPCRFLLSEGDASLVRGRWGHGRLRLRHHGKPGSNGISMPMNLVTVSEIQRSVSGPTLRVQSGVPLWQQRSNMHTCVFKLACTNSREKRGTDCISSRDTSLELELSTLALSPCQSSHSGLPTRCHHTTRYLCQAVLAVSAIDRPFAPTRSQSGIGQS